MTKEAEAGVLSAHLENGGDKSGTICFSTASISAYPGCKALPISAAVHLPAYTAGALPSITQITVVKKTLGVREHWSRKPA